MSEKTDTAPLSLPNAADVRVAASRLKGRVFETPLLRNTVLDEMAGARLWLKAENLQETGSFKLRGALNALLQIPSEQRRYGVVAFSSGNHARGISRAAKKLGMPALIVMPHDAPAIKIDGVRADGATIHFYQRESESREDIAAEFAKLRGAALIPSFDHPDIIAGQGSCGIELGAQLLERGLCLQHLICCTGGGGLITGIALGLEASGQKATKLWTAEPQGHDDWARSLQTGKREKNAPGTRSICDAILTPQPGRLTFALGEPRLAGGLCASEASVRAAMRAAFTELKLVLEPGGAAALAAALFHLPDTLKGSDIGIILSGGNVDPALFAKIIDDHAS